MSKSWTEEQLWQVARAYQESAVLLAAGELDVFTALAGDEVTAGQLAEALDGDLRATTMLADALAAMELLVKRDGRYSVAPGVADVMAADGADSELALMRHTANCLRGWAQLATVVRTGQPGERPPSIRGEEADLEAFIEAMENASRQAAPRIVREIGPPSFGHLLDVGGGPGTWTIAFLQAVPGATATLYDCPNVVPIAEKHFRDAGLLDRVTLVPGDFYEDDALPGGADLAWVSAIVHQNSRRQNRDLFAKVHAALVPGGRILLRDVVMGAARTDPRYGAMFAINMLVNTPGGGTFTFEELGEDLAAAGFAEPTLLRRDPAMNSVVQATKR